jgi:hypothetical protein
MKFVVTWTARAGGSAAESEEAARRSLEVFSKWSPPAGLTIHQFVVRLDGGGGLLVGEADDPKALADGPAKFAPWFEFTTIPVIDVTEGVTIANEAIAFRDSVT